VFGGQPPPHIDIRRELARYDDQILTGPNADVARYSRQTIGNSRNHGYPIGIVRTDQLGKGPSDRLYIREEICGFDGGGDTLSPPPFHPRLLDTA
jgi:hypothetical protein